MASRKEEKESQQGREGETTLQSSDSQQRRELEQQLAVTQSIDETKQDIRQALEEAKQDIPKYNQVVKDYQNETIDSASDIADSYLESQKQIINSMQAVWTNNMNQMQSWWGMQTMSPKAMADTYTRMAKAVADATVAATRMGNNTLFASMEEARTHMNYARDNAKEFARVSTSLYTAYGDTMTGGDGEEKGSSGSEGGRQRRASR